MATWNGTHTSAPACWLLVAACQSVSRAGWAGRPRCRAAASKHGRTCMHGVASSLSAHHHHHHHATAVRVGARPPCRVHACPWAPGWLQQYGSSGPCRGPVAVGPRRAPGAGWLTAGSLSHPDCRAPTIPMSCHHDGLLRYCRMRLCLLRPAGARWPASGSSSCSSPLVNSSRHVTPTIAAPTDMHLLSTRIYVPLVVCTPSPLRACCSRAVIRPTASFLLLLRYVRPQPTVCACAWPPAPAASRCKPQ